MQRVAFAALMLTTTPIVIDAHEEMPSYPLLSSPHWQQINKMRQDNADLLFIQDGRRIEGSLTAIPAIKFSFGQISFRPDEVSLLILPREEGGKIHVITSEGCNYIGDSASEPLQFVCDDPAVAAGGGLHNAVAILGKNNDHVEKTPENPLFTLELNNGGLLTVLINEPKVAISNGRRETKLAPEEIVKLSKCEGVYIDRGQGVERLSSSFVKDSCISVVIPKTGQHLRICWNEIESVKKFNPEDDEEMFDAFAKALNVQGSIFGEPGINSCCFTHVCRNEDKVVGMALPGPNLEGALAAEGIGAETIEGLQRISRELVIDQIACEAWADHIPQQFFVAESDIPADILFTEELVANLESEPSQPVEQASLHLAMQDLDDIDFEGSSIQEAAEDEESASDEYTFISSAHKKEPLVEKDSTPRDLIAYHDIAETLEKGGKQIDAIYQGQFFLAEEEATFYDIEDSLAELFKDVEEAFDEDHLLQGEFEGAASISQLEVQASPLGNPNSERADAALFIGRQKLSNLQYYQFSRATGHAVPPHWIGGKIPKGQEREPVANVSLSDVQAYAAWMDRLSQVKIELLKALEMGTIHHFNSSSRGEILLQPLRVEVLSLPSKKVF